MKILVTGGAGFIGSAVIRHLIAETNFSVLNVDKLTYAANLQSLQGIAKHPRYYFENADICDSIKLRAMLKQFAPDAIMHLAAESHVDRSIDHPADFIQTNIVGTHVLLEQTQDYWNHMPAAKKQRFRFHHISTDEVYGSLGSKGLFDESAPHKPNSPYSASKAASDHLVRAWFHTYGLPAITTHCSNNYGPYQFPEKFIPLIILNAVEGKALPVYGTGSNVRDWLYVNDHANALHRVLMHGRVGETYNIGGQNERTNLEVVKLICTTLREVRPLHGQTAYEDLIRFVDDRPGHDMRYAIDSSKLNTELGWRPQETFESGMKKTIAWYLDNEHWRNSFQSGHYKRERLGRLRE